MPSPDTCTPFIGSFRPVTCVQLMPLSVTLLSKHLIQQLARSGVICLSISASTRADPVVRNCSWARSMAINLGLARKPTESSNFDLQTAVTLYWATVPAVVQQQGRDQQNADLTVRILSGVDRHIQSSRVREILCSLLRADKMLQPVFVVRLRACAR